MYRKNGEARASLPRMVVRRHRLAKAAIAATFVGSAGLAFAPLASATPKNVVQDLSLPEAVSLNFAAEVCNNVQSTISMSGHAVIGGVALELHFRPSANANPKLTKTADGTLDLNLDDGQKVDIPKKSGLGGPIGGNPHIYFSFDNYDATSHAYSENRAGQLYLGRCVQGLTLNPVGGNVHIPGKALGTVATDVCSPQQSHGNVNNASKKFDGAKGHLYFYNNDNKDLGTAGYVPGVHKTTAGATITVDIGDPQTGPGKGWGVGGVGGNPDMLMRYKNHVGLIGTHFTDGNGNDQLVAYFDVNGSLIGGSNTNAPSEQALGRCKDLLG
jgi:hypothetical protein